MDSLLGHCASQSTEHSTNLFLLLLQSLLSAHCSISSPDDWPADYASEALSNGLDTYDFVIIGAGSAGSVLANRLSKNSDWKVLLLEAGGDPLIESEIPLMNLHLQNTNSTWNFYDEPNELAGRNYPKGSYWPSGKMLGGSGGVNTMLYTRGNPSDYDRWEELGNEGWNWESALKYFKKSEDMQMSSFLNMNKGKYHSAGGELKISSYYSVEPLKNVLLEAALEKEHEEIIDINADKHVGFSINGGTLYNGQRNSPAKAFLTPVKDRKNLHIIKNAQATKILFENNRAVGVDFDLKTGTESKSLSVKISKEVIVSAGAINSPKLLQLSGVGPKDLLEKHNIPIVSDLNVGNNLQDHISVPLFYKYHTSRSEPYTESNFANEIYMYTLHRVGPMASLGVTDLLGFVNTENRTELYPNIQFSFTSFLRETPGLESLLTNMGYSKPIVQTIVEANKEAHIFQVMVSLLKPTSRGSVAIKSNSPNDDPLITSNFLKKGADDLKTLMKGIKEFKSFEETRMFKVHEIEYIKVPLTNCDTGNQCPHLYWECYTRELATTGHDQVGTNKMGPKTDKEAVVDARLKVHNVNGLRVIDNSIMPEIISSGTFAAAVMIGEKGADFIKEDWATTS